MLDDQYPLVGGIPTPLKNMSSSIGMIIPNIWKNKKKKIPNHQPDNSWWLPKSRVNLG